MACAYVWWDLITQEELYEQQKNNVDIFFLSIINYWIYHWTWDGYQPISALRVLYGHTNNAIMQRGSCSSSWFFYSGWIQHTPLAPLNSHSTFREVLASQLGLSIVHRKRLLSSSSRKKNKKSKKLTICQCLEIKCLVKESVSIVPENTTNKSYSKFVRRLFQSFSLALFSSVRQQVSKSVS